MQLEREESASALSKGGAVASAKEQRFAKSHSRMKLMRERSRALKNSVDIDNGDDQPTVATA